VVFNGGYCSGLPAVLTPAFRQSVILTAGKYLSIETAPQGRQTGKKRGFGPGWKGFLPGLPPGSQIRRRTGKTFAGHGMIRFNERVVVGQAWPKW
jgi:hypothetical protein